MDISGASAIVTGGASGIGAASARMLAEVTGTVSFGKDTKGKQRL